MATTATRKPRTISDAETAALASLTAYADAELTAQLAGYDRNDAQIAAMIAVDVAVVAKVAVSHLAAGAKKIAADHGAAAWLPTSAQQMAPFQLTGRVFAKVTPETDLGDTVDQWGRPIAVDVDTFHAAIAWLCSHGSTDEARATIDASDDMAALYVELVAMRDAKGGGKGGAKKEKPAKVEPTLTDSLLAAAQTIADATALMATWDDDTREAASILAEIVGEMVAAGKKKK